MPTRRLRMIVLSAAAPAALSLALLAGPALFADQPEQKKPGQGAEKVDGAEAAAAGAAAAAQDGPKPDAAPAAPEQSAKVSPEAKQVIEKIDAAYAGVQRLELAGTFSADFDAAGTERKE